ncbi:MAG: PD40 domain-containing protein, partial [Gemmatimonadetes bacterium]|nr:PD40 domain-containing protein [Gemmatimonadota bacterium]
ICTFNGVDAALGSLNGAANGAGRVEVSATVPGRPTGAPAFAWRPGGSTRIAFARDTVLDSLYGVIASRIYDVNGAGTTVTPLSPKVTDLGRGPLRIEGSIDWSPDGSTIVFSASDTTSYELALYALDVTTGAVRRLTTPPTGWVGDLYPSFSPDGQRILYRRVNYYYCCGMIQDYFVVRLTGGGPTRLTFESSNWGAANLDPYYLGGDWSPNGGSVVITAPNGLGGRAAYRVPIDITGAADYAARRTLVGTAGIAGLNDYGVSWQP